MPHFWDQCTVGKEGGNACNMGGSGYFRDYARLFSTAAEKMKGGQHDAITGEVRARHSVCGEGRALIRLGQWDVGLAWISGPDSLCWGELPRA